jgi:hypothetical protein
MTLTMLPLSAPPVRRLRSVQAAPVMYVEGARTMVVLRGEMDREALRPAGFARRRRTWVAASAGLGLAAVVAGCGSSRTATPPAAPANSSSAVLAAYTHTVGAKTARVSMWR